MFVGFTGGFDFADLFSDHVPDMGGPAVAKDAARYSTSSAQRWRLVLWTFQVTSSSSTVRWVMNTWLGMDGTQMAREE